MTDLGLSAQLPHEPALEAKVLAGLLTHANWSDLPSHMAAETFVLREHADVFRLALGEHKAGRPATGPALLARCQNGLRDTLKGLAALDGLATDVRGYAPALVELQLRRDLVAVGCEIEALGLDLRPGESAAGNLAKAVDHVSELRARFRGDDTAADDWQDGLRSVDACGNTYEPPEQLVAGFLTTGLTVLSATPKTGKTTLVHEFAIGSASGRNALGVLPCQQSEVLALFFEDSERRCITRERELLGNGDGVGGLTYFTNRSVWTTERLGRYLDLRPACRIVIIDTGARYRGMQALETTGQVYADDYRFYGELQSFAQERGIALLLLLHHDRKPNGSGGNALDTVSGTRAITGAADHVWLLDRNQETGLSTLRVVGRDLDEKTIQFSRDGARRLFAAEQPVIDMVARLDQRARARKMRADGESFAAIAKALGVAKSTAESWCKEQVGGSDGK